MQTLLLVSEIHHGVHSLVLALANLLSLLFFFFFQIDVVCTVLVEYLFICRALVQVVLTNQILDILVGMTLR